jgi:hypothetical protein
MYLIHHTSRSAMRIVIFIASDSKTVVDSMSLGYVVGGLKLLPKCKYHLMENRIFFIQKSSKIYAPFTLSEAISQLWWHHVYSSYKQLALMS